jgi:N-acetylmuramoyl-L-alanine amidase
VDPAFQQDMAEAIMSGVRTYFAQGAVIART